MPDDPYLDPGSGCLINKLGLTDPVELQTAERSAALLREHSIRMWGLDGEFDYDHLMAIHRTVFQDIYEWAGEPRTVNTSRTHPFCLVSFLDGEAKRIFGELAADNHLRELGRSEFSDRLTYYMAEVNALHPFRDGNGRSQRLFFELLARQAGYELDWSRVDERQNVEACVMAMEQNLDPMRELIDAVVREVST